MAAKMGKMAFFVTILVEKEGCRHCGCKYGINGVTLVGKFVRYEENIPFCCVCSFIPLRG
jgi:hypothetical protein